MKKCLTFYERNVSLSKVQRAFDFFFSRALLFTMNSFYLYIFISRVAIDFYDFADMQSPCTSNNCCLLHVEGSTQFNCLFVHVEAFEIAVIFNFALRRSAIRFHDSLSGRRFDMFSRFFLVFLVADIRYISWFSFALAAFNWRMTMVFCNIFIDQLFCWTNMKIFFRICRHNLMVF